MADIALMVISENTASERRITPSWTISQLKSKLESVTGTPPWSQRLFIKTLTNGKVPIEADDEDSVRLAQFPLSASAELHVVDTRPAGAKPNFSDTSRVEKYVMPLEEYAKRTDSVLSWKKTAKLGRFDADVRPPPSHEQAKIATLAREVERRGITVGKRCRVGDDDTRRGDVRYVGEVPEIPRGIGAWVGVQLDEPVGKNDGTLGGTRYWGEPSEIKRGVFVRPERVEVGDFPVLDHLEDMEEI